MNLSWMAWTWPTAIFFVVIALMLVGMTLWESASPGGSPRVGILRFETTRGDRFFVSLLGSAFICLAWLGFLGGLAESLVEFVAASSPDLAAVATALQVTAQNLWWALGLCLVYALGVFRWV